MTRFLFNTQPVPDGVTFEVHLVPERRVFLRSDPRQGQRLLSFAVLADAYHMGKTDRSHVNHAAVVDGSGATVMELAVVVVEYRLESHLEQVALDIVSANLIGEA